MKNQLENHRKYIFIGIIIIAFGITFSTTLKDTLGSLGIVFIVVGAIFFIIGMSKKRKSDEKNNK